MSYGEPWKVNARKRVEDCRGYDLEKDCADGFDNRHVERIVACVNFCAGIPTERLVGHPEGKILVGDGDRARVLACLDNCQDLNPSGIPGLISAVEQVVGAMNAYKLQTGWEDTTNVLSTLEGALRGCRLTPEPPAP